MMHDVQTALKMLDARGGELDKKVAEIIREGELRLGALREQVDTASDPCE